MHLVKNWEPAPARSVLAVRDAVEHRKSGSWPFPTSQWGITSVRIQTTEHIHNVISNWKRFSEGNGVLTKLLGGLTRKSRNHHWTIYLNGIVLTLILKTGRCCYYWHGCPLTTNSKLETRIGMPCVSTTTNSNISMALLTSKRNLHVFSEFWKGRKKGMSMAKDFCVLHSIIQQSGMLLNTDDGTAFSFLHLVDFFSNLFFYWRIIVYRILLFSVNPQHESAIGIHISPPFWTSLPSPSPSHPSRLIQSPCLSFLSHTANSCWLYILHMVI